MSGRSSDPDWADRSRASSSVTRYEVHAHAVRTRKRDEGGAAAKRKQKTVVVKNSTYPWVCDLWKQWNFHTRRPQSGEGSASSGGS